MSDINHEQYILNRDGFLQAAHIALLYKMLAIVGYKYPSAEFDQLRREATRNQIVEQVHRYSVQMSESPWMPKDEPDTATEARIRKAEIDQAAESYRESFYNFGNFPNKESDEQ